MKDKLRESCIELLELLKKMKDEGKINEDEYHKHTKIKLKFLRYDAD